MRGVVHREERIMDEILLVDMMSELYPELLENNYIERDMKKGRLSLLSRFFSFGKTQDLQEETFSDKAVRIDGTDMASSQERIDGQDSVKPDSPEGEPLPTSLPISIFTREFPIFKIISGFAAVLFVIGGIILFLFKHNKDILKIFDRKTQISY